MTTEQMIDGAATAKKMLADLEFSGKPWKIALIETYAAAFVVREKDFLLEQVALTSKTQTDVELLCERIVDRINQKRLDSVLTSIIAAMTDAQKEAVAWTVLVKLSHIDRRASEIAPDIIWEKDGTGFSLKFPTFSVQSTEQQIEDKGE